MVSGRLLLEKLVVGKCVEEIVLGKCVGEIVLGKCVGESTTKRIKYIFN